MQKVSKLESIMAELAEAQKETQRNFHREQAQLKREQAKRKRLAAQRKRLEAQREAQRKREQAKRKRLAAQRKAEREREQAARERLAAQREAQREREQAEFKRLQAEREAQRKREQAERDAEFKRLQAERDAEFKRQIDLSRKEQNEIWGRLANKMGTVIEDVVAPNIPRIAREHFNLTKVEDFLIRATRTSRRGTHRQAEFDIIAFGQNKLVVVEVKNTVRTNDVKSAPKRLAAVTDFFPEYDGAEIFPIIASWAIPRNLLPLIAKHQLYGLAMGDSTMEIVASPSALDSLGTDA